MSAVIDTGRLLIRQFDAEEEHLFLGLYTDPVVTKYLNKRSPEENRKRFAETIDRYNDGTGLYRWAIFNRADSAFIGVCGLKPSDAGPYCTELGYILHQKYWGKGIAGEMAKALIHYAFTQTNVTEFLAFTMLDNAASQRVLEKSGFSRQENVFRDGEQLAFFRLLKAAP